jgi:hypothetical protein
MKFGKFASINPRLGSIQVAKHKYFEYQFEFNRFYDQPFDFRLSWSTKQDHAGITFIFSIYKLFWLSLSVCDSRHWDHKNNKWHTNY